MNLRMIALAVGAMSLPNGAAFAQLDLQRAATERLPNGLTLIVLEERSVPSVSVQMLYRAGARDEAYGLTGIAHFLEHMAFRATREFPDTEVVSRIYAAGGEWHGYTWIDQTTYYATVPREEFGLLLRIEADRMAALELDPALIEPERGAVLAEMHGYENDPGAVLHDAVVFTALQAHPYRNNTIGWESDVRAIGHEDLLAFYRRHYVPANAVLAVVGDVDRHTVSARVAQLFGDLPALPRTPLPRTIEPPQAGERRIELLGAGAEARLEIAWQAPGVDHADFAAFLLLQEWLGGGSGINFIQSFGTTPVRPGSLLDGMAAEVSTWFPPAAQTYLFAFAAALPADADPAAAEAAVEAAVARLRDAPASVQQLDALKHRVLAELLFDVGTHEDAAHQLAFFDGLGAPDLLRTLPAQVAALDAQALRSAAQRWLQPHQRTIGWYRAGAKPAPAAAQLAPAIPVSSGLRPDAAPAAMPAMRGGIDAPVVTRLPNGLPLIVQQSRLSPTAHVRVVLNSASVTGGPGLSLDDPVWGVASLSAHCLPDDLAATLRQLRASLGALEALPPDAEPSGDPATRLEQGYAALLGFGAADPRQPVAASLVVVSGAVDAAQVQAEAAQWFGDAAFDELTPASGPIAPAQDIRIELPLDRAQAQIGYAVPAPVPADEAFWNWRALLYVLTHGYEGRLGKEAISRRGLAYYIDGQYRSNGRAAWIAISTGVDPDKLATLEALYRSELTRLVAEPPTEAEVAEARSHFIGRLATARQGNEELSAGLAEQWLWWGRVLPERELRAAIEGIDHAGVARAAGDFARGRIAVVAVGKTPAAVTD